MNGNNIDTPRVYQDEAKYGLPSDAPEHERLERQAESLVALMNGRPFHAPVSKPERILDIGCGTGYVTHMLALSYPAAQVIGIDIAPVPELKRGRLENEEYVQADILDVIGVDPRFELSSFDYIFSRFLIKGMRKWPEYIASISGLLKPSGWVELQEPDLTLRTSRRETVGELSWFFQCYKADSIAVGLDIEIGNHLLNLVSSTPTLKNIREAQYSFNPNPTDETPELLAMTAQLPTLFTMGTRNVCRRAGRKQEEIEILAETIRSALERGFEEGVQLTIHAVIGQKRPT